MAQAVPPVPREGTPMNDRLIKKLRRKNGTTMLEVIVAACILVIVVMAAVMAINLSHATVLSQGSSANAAAQAQDLADQLITELHTKSPQDSAEDVGADYVAPEDFPNSTYDKQFTAKYVNQDGIEGYKIRTAVYYTDSNGRKCVQMQAFSAKDGG